MLSSLPITVILLISAALAAPLPVDDAIITLNHYSKSTNLTTSHSINASSLSPELSKTLKSSSALNINFIGEREKRHSSSTLLGRTVHETRRINNSTINLTVVGGNEKRSNGTADHHNVIIDASGPAGGIHNSTLNINLNTRSIDKSAPSTIGHHSILISTNSETPAAAIDSSRMDINILPRAVADHHSIVITTVATGEEAAIQSTIMNLNVLPRRSPIDIGDHSVLIATNSNSDSPHTAGHHSVIMETLSNSTKSSSSAIKDSTINVTVVGGNKKLEARSKSLAWIKSINRKNFLSKSTFGQGVKKMLKAVRV